MALEYAWAVSGTALEPLWRSRDLNLGPGSKRSITRFEYVNVSRLRCKNRGQWTANDGARRKDISRGRGVPPTPHRKHQLDARLPSYSGATRHRSSRHTPPSHLSKPFIHHPMWFTSPLNFGLWRPHGAPAPAATRATARGKGLAGRKSRRRATKAPPLITPFQKYKKRERVSWASDSGGSQSSFSSSRSSSFSSVPTEKVPSPPASSESTAANQVFEVRLPMEFAKLRLRSNWQDGKPQVNPFDRPGVRARLERQCARDRASLALLPTQAPPVFTTNPLSRTPSGSSDSSSSSDFPLRPASSSFVGLPAHQNSYILQKWHGLKKEVDERKADERVYAAVRGQNPMAARRWQRYERDWATAMDADDSPPLRFTDIPWPVMHLPHNGSHITAVEVYRFVLCSEELETVPFNAVPLLQLEAERWHTERFAAYVLPRVVRRDRQDVAAAAATVLDILLAALRDLYRYEAARYRR
ncbi:hypothetical protein C8F04DRAFT_277896 [Mycena alexandri]|uniref:Uncharacterized protein n=1 Tax=Mycena alexandri TaxID=1745969 RepID=A0AAD6T9C3_9AGAR|nr:hypothetical protein C8F04DRAFT_277896 [Mycena alexandri]